MRFSSLITAIVMTVTLFAAPSIVQAKHRFFASVHPLTNYLDRCLGIGWSDGYHSPQSKWNRPHSQHVPFYSPSVPYAGSPMFSTNSMVPVNWPRQTPYQAPVLSGNPAMKAPVQTGRARNSRR